MKVALVYRDALKQGGYPRDARWLAAALADAGLEVTLVAEQGPECEGLTGDVRWIPFEEAGRATAFDIVHELFGIFITGQAEVARRMRTRAYVISPGAHLMPSHLRRRWWKKAPYLVWWRALHAGTRRALHVFSALELATARMVAGTSRSFEASLGVFPPPSFRPEQADEIGTAAAGPILFLGRNDVAQKGIDVLIRGFARSVALGSRLDLCIAGRPWGDSERRIAELVARLGVTERVLLMGETDEASKWGLLREARCLAFLSRWDGPPRPVREALSVGTPVIVSPGTNMGDLVSAEGAGVAVATDPADVARALLACEDDQRISLWREGARRLAATLAWSNVAVGYLRGYESILAVAQGSPE